ncbi:MAG: PEGA domain-containing protein [Butyrivibrio sp.]
MKKLIYINLYIILICVCCTGCNADSTTAGKHYSQTVETKEDPKDVSSLAVITNVDYENKIIEFYKIETEEECMYSYNVGTTVLTKTGRTSSIQSLSKGDVVDIYYDPVSFKISQIQISPDSQVWENINVTSFSVNDSTRSMTVGTSLFYYKDDLYVVSDEERISVTELTGADRLTIRGVGNRIVSVIVDKGHGYITLKGADIFLGGLVDIGGSIIKVIEENMLIIVPEGTHKVEVRNGDNIAEKYVTVARGEQCVADFSDVAANITETGSIKFDINIGNASLYIDNVKRDQSNTLTLSVGKHSVIVTAEGYVTYSSYIDVKPGHQKIEITLGKDSEGETSSEEETTEKPSTGEEETVVSKINDVTVSGPVGGLVYFDSTYMGVAPVTFDMVTGTHVISIINGKQINSYTVTLAEGGDDVEYDFTDK